MTPESVKPQLERDKTFLEELYCSQSVPNSKRILNFASDNKLHTLVKIFHFITSGQIKIKREHFEKLPNRLLNIMKRNFEKKSSTRRLLNSDRKERLKVLCRLAPFFSELLYPLFNET